MKLTSNMGILILSCLVLVGFSHASRYQSCIVEEYLPSDSFQRKMDLGLYGRWNESFEETMITVHDYHDTATRFYTLSKKPMDRDPKGLLLFLHGFPEFSWAWEEQLEYFGDSYHAVAIDIKGHHYSSKPEVVSEYDYVKSAREIKELVKCLGYDTLMIVGHDFGGAIAYSFASLYPEMLHGLVVLNAPHLYTYGREFHNPEGDQKSKSFYIDIAQGTSTVDQMHFFASIFTDTSILANDFYRGFRIFRIIGESWSSLNNWERMKNYYRSMFYPPDPDFFKPAPTELHKSVLRIHTPTLILWGLDDPYLSPRLLDNIEDFVPDVQVITFPNLTHWIHHELEDLNAYLEDFFLKHSPE